MRNYISPIYTSILFFHVLNILISFNNSEHVNINDVLKANMILRQNIKAGNFKQAIVSSTLMNKDLQATIEAKQRSPMNKDLNASIKAKQHSPNDSDGPIADETIYQIEEIPIYTTNTVVDFKKFEKWYKDLQPFELEPPEVCNKLDEIREQKKRVLNSEALEEVVELLDCEGVKVNPEDKDDVEKFRKMVLNKLATYTREELVDLLDSEGVKVNPEDK
eukprot:g1846.t1